MRLMWVTSDFWRKWHTHENYNLTLVKSIPVRVREDPSGIKLPIARIAILIYSINASVAQ